MGGARDGDMRGGQERPLGLFQGPSLGARGGDLRSGQSRPSTGQSVLNFYDRGKEGYELTNFSPHPISVGGVRYATSENYFQAKKFEGRTPQHQEAMRQIQEAPNARAAFEMARRPEFQKLIRPDWAHVKDDVMRQALEAKFTQHPQLGSYLVGTGSRKLVEHTSNDTYWADGGDGSGKNKLGELLMEVRSKLAK